MKYKKQLKRVVEASADASLTNAGANINSLLLGRVLPLLKKFPPFFSLHPVDTRPAGGPQEGMELSEQSTVK